MPYESTIYIVCSSVSITISITIALMFWERRSASGAKSMSFMLAFAALWTIFDLFSALSNSTETKLLFNKMAYTGPIVIPLIWLVFSLQFTRNIRYLTRRNLFLLSAIPFLSLLLLWTNYYHHLFFVETRFAKAGLITLTVQNYGTWFWVHVAFSYLSILLGSIIILRRLMNEPQVYRQQAVVMVLAIFYPFVGSVLYSFNILPSYPVDPTMFSFSFSGILFFFCMFRLKLFNLIPTARAAVIDSMDTMIIVLDNQNRIIDINSSLRSILKRNERELIGQSIYSLLDRIPSGLTKYLESTSAYEKIVLPIDNKNLFYDFRIAPLFNDKNKYMGRYVTLRDITALEEAMENSEKSRKAAEEASKAKSQFLATMSHEIRTPLNGIIGMGELLASANLTSDEKNFLLSIQTSASSLLDIVNNILDFSKIEAGKLSLENTCFNFNDLVKSTVKMFEYKALEKNLQLALDLDKEVPETLNGDQIRLRQILINLIGNSLKFTEIGQIKIKTEKLNLESNKLLVKISVEDTGIGIPEDKIPSLFNSFEQLDNSTTRKYGGTGLGLSIVKCMVEIMGGNINVISKPGIGSKFSFSIPLKVSDGEKTNNQSIAPAIDSLNKNVNILLAEDNKVNQMFMTKLLEKMAFKVDLAENGIKVLEKYNQNNYSVILMDIQMPEMDGYEATLAIRNSEKSSYRHIPIIALTANATAEDRDKCILSGMDDYMSKPVKSEKLYACIQKYI